MRSWFTSKSVVYWVLGLFVLVAGWAVWFPEEEIYTVAPSRLEYVGSDTCRECHPDSFGDWKSSVHALAERPLDVDVDTSAFDPPRSIPIVDVTSEVSLIDEEFCLHTLGGGGEMETFHPVRVIGETPLRQFLIPRPRGYFQVSSLAFDPTRGEWFDVFGDENRQPHEWGFWDNKGMTWNTMCAECHNTRVRKNYDFDTDTYQTTMEEMAVGCEACHGPGQAHVHWHRSFHLFGSDPYRPLTGKRLIDTCGTCHARRTALTEDFFPGDRFLDHYVPELPNETDIYYPDGQVREEDYVYSSFRMSRMYHEGVTCLDCHLPHSSRLKLQGNHLCLQCHADKIHPTEHSHHKVDQPGGFCVSCHMPTTIYMQRQPRHDHAFTIPDPKLTIEAGVPNACNRCHEDQTAEWALEATEKWWGPVDQRINGKRSRAVLAARLQDSGAVPRLLEIVRSDPLSTWKAIAAGLLRTYLGDPRALAAVADLLDHPDPLVRTSAVGSLEGFGEDLPIDLRPLLEDPVRSVRIRAAWLLHRDLDDQHPAFRELIAYLRLAADQPTGALQLATLLRQRERLNEAISLLKRALEWSPDSEILWESLAGVYSQAGRNRDAVAVLEKAGRELPHSARIRYSLGLAYAETGDLDSTISALHEACALEPEFTRAWYNLGLALHQAGQTDEALDALRHAVELEPGNPDYPYALATVCRDLGRTEDAIHYLKQTLGLRPDHRQAASLLRILQNPSPQ